MPNSYFCGTEEVVICFFILSNLNLFAVKRKERQGWNIYKCAGRGGVGHWFYFAKNRLGLDTGLMV